MASTNRAKHSLNTTHEGAKARTLRPLDELRRTVMCCLLWEDSFYESGEDAAERIRRLAMACKPSEVASLAVEARHKFHLRHVPLLLLEVLSHTAAGSRLLPVTVESVVSRVDEMGELLAIMKKHGMTSKVPHGVRRGLAACFHKFDEYQFSKYKGEKKEYSLQAVCHLVHPNPQKDVAKAKLFKRIADGTLGVADTWEVALSRGQDKRETFERLLREERLGYMAVLKNLRGMSEAGVDEELIIRTLRLGKGLNRILPWRFLTAMRAAPQFNPVLDEMLLRRVKSLPAFPGKTVICVDTSASMSAPVSRNSVIRRYEVAAILATMFQSSEDLAPHLVNFATYAEKIPFYPGLAGVDLISSLEGTVGHGTAIDRAVAVANNMDPERIIVVTDCQSHTSVRPPNARWAYHLNVADYANSVAFGRWVEISGFSEQVFRFMAGLEGVEDSEG